MNELIKKIEQWSIERDLHNANPMKQYDKLVEEYGELVKGLNKQDEQLIKDSIGDMFVVITIMTQQIKGNMNHVMDYKHIDENEELGKQSTLRFMGTLTYSGVGLTELLSNADDYRIRKSLVDAGLANLVYLLDETAKAHGTDLKSCVQLAYDEIKDRKGEMRDGKFVKQEDL
ncbi:MAG: MazG-like family protein [Staphylococcus rostri]|uniref:MazG-like family protein n=1 Tax=Staphylococcus rostri TaxID=522262 RepID=UPI0026DFF572|nr:MazG-like family protein [Staphylococcus rostri]MDO5375705.1 MazG-like family protein [Staphylococcus rostri]